MLDTLDALERIEAEEGPGDGMAAEGILERYVEWQAMKDLGGGAVENGAQEQAEALEKDEESWQERTQGGTRQKDSGSMKREFPSGNNIGKDGEEESSKGRSGKKRRWWVDMHKRLLCSNIRVRH